jgi:hypothetical protein
MRKAIVALVLFFTAAMSASAQSLPPPPATGGKCVGVMSIVGHKFTLRKVGITVFSNEDNTIPVNWSSIDELVAGKVTAFLGKRVSVRRLSYSKSAVASWENPGGSPFRRPNDELREIVRAAAGSQRCDQHVAITRWGSQVAGTNQAITGLGILEHGAPIYQYTYLYAAVGFVVFDGTTFEIVRQQPVRSSDPIMSLLKRGPGGLSREVDRSWWPDPAKVAQDAKLRNAMRSLVDQGLTATLPRAFPPPGS